MQGRAEAVDFEYTNLIQDGLSQLRAKTLYAEIEPLIVWDGDARDSGGAASMAQHWMDHGIIPFPNINATKPKMGSFDNATLVHEWFVALCRGNGITPNIIDISKIRRKGAIEVSLRKEQPVAKHPCKTRRRKLPEESSRRICAMLFGDVVGFTNLREDAKRGSGISSRCPLLAKGETIANLQRTQPGVSSG